MCLVLGLLFALGPDARAQGADPLAQSMGLTRESKSLPVWSKPSAGAVRKLTDAVKSDDSSIVLVGSPKIGFGTAWVLSNKNRLLATNAHVADILHKAGGKMLGIRNGTSELYTIDRAWYHPGVMRYVNNGFSVRSSNPDTGGVNPTCPDVAVLHVADGADLPPELSMASATEMNDCFAQPVGMFGFPGHDTTQWPGLGEKAVGTFREGVIARLTDFRGNAGAAPAELQFLQHTMASWFGFSGSPIFLPNGHVVALNNSGKSETQNGLSVSLAYGVRIDCLWELLAFHNLDILVPIPIEKDKLLLDRYNHPDPNEEKYHKAQDLTYEAYYLSSDHKYFEAVTKCNEAIALAPNFAAAYSERARAYNGYVIDLNDSLGTSQGGRQLYYDQLALADDKKYLQLAPTDAEAYESVCNGMMGVQIATTGYSRNSQVEQMLTKLLETNSLTAVDRSTAYRMRSEARGYETESLGDMNEAVRLVPFDPDAYYGRAQYWKGKDDNRYAADIRRSNELRDAQTKNGQAWKMATSANKSDRNGQEAYRIAAEICQATDYGYWRYLLTLAAAYYECGDFKHAAEYGDKALKLTTEDNDKSYCKLWQDYFLQKVSGGSN
jgi:hypothetical protein